MSQGTVVGCLIIVVLRGGRARVSEGRAALQFAKDALLVDGGDQGPITVVRIADLVERGEKWALRG